MFLQGKHIIYGILNFLGEVYDRVNGMAKDYNKAKMKGQVNLQQLKIDRQSHREEKGDHQKQVMTMKIWQQMTMIFMPFLLFPTMNIVGTKIMIMILIMILR